jgi:hypothetical protein
MFVIGSCPLHNCVALWSHWIGLVMRRSARQRHDAATLEFQLGAPARLSVTRRVCLLSLVSLSSLPAMQVSQAHLLEMMAKNSMNLVSQESQNAQAVVPGQSVDYGQSMGGRWMARSGSGWMSRQPSETNRCEELHVMLIN